MRTFYGQSFLADVCEIGEGMLPYSRGYFDELVRTGTVHEVRPSDTWYEARTDFGPNRIGTPLTAHRDQGFKLLQGSPTFSGEVLGGCIDTLFACSTADATPTCPLSASGTASFQVLRSGPARSCCSNRARRR